MYASGRSNTSCILSLSTQCCVPCLQISGGWDLALCVWDLSTGRYIHYVNSIGHVPYSAKCSRHEMFVVFED